MSLSSLLNPSPTDTKGASHDNIGDASSSPTVQLSIQQHDSLPPISSIQSPESHYAEIPKYTPPERPRAGSGVNTTGNAGMMSNILTLQSAQDMSMRRTSAGSSGHASIELPPPPASAARKMSSPTLEQYHVVSRSPEQLRRTSASLTSGVQLPPLQTTVSQSAHDASTLREHTDTHVSRGSAVGSSPSHATAAALLSSTNQDGQASSLDMHAPPVLIKEELVASPQDAAALNLRQLPTFANEHDPQVSKTLSTLKTEHASRTQSPLRESSFALPTTEDTSPNTTTTKKRPPPSRAKKGTATATKKLRAATKKRKTDKVPALKNGSSIGTPAMSSPSPSDVQSQFADEYEDDDESMADSDEDVEGSGDVYCICRKPDNGTFMIGCDGQCDDWFHGKCVGMEERDKNLIDKYICPRCTASGVGQTSWKRICRRQGCRQPARVGRNVGKNGAISKYCSDECGVKFFRQMTANSRDVEQAGKERATRRKSGNQSSAATSSEANARGGVLSISEVRALLDQTNSAGDFRELGNGVLSPPATPSGTTLEDDGLTDMERTAVKSIAAQKEQARERHQLLKDRLKFITLVKNEANRAAAEKDLKPKEYCGFDTRLEWTEEEFAAWRQSKQGKQVFETECSDQSNHSTDRMDTLLDTNDGSATEAEVCIKKKCPRHMDWSKLAVDDVRFEMTDNSNRMRSLEHEEHEIRDRASLRATARKFDADEGQVELHEFDSGAADRDYANGITGVITAAAMDIDTTV